MPTLVTEQGIVHYETLGRGRPVLLLHGWLGSWALWRQTIEVLSREFKTYALDFFGFGESFVRGADFSVDNFVLSVNQFMDRLGIPKAAMIGHSMGGTVSLAASTRYPDKIVKTAVVGSPIQGSSLNFLLKFSGYRGFASIAFYSPALLRMFLRLYSHYIAKDGNALGKMIVEDTSRVTVESFFQSIGTLRETDLRSQIGELQMPVLGVYGKYDRIVSPRQSQVLKEHCPSSRIAWFEGSGHFPMLDEPDRFYTTIQDFLHNN
ncbi:MAG: alpha/beta hydrolase [Anaerolineae bacterium]